MLSVPLLVVATLSVLDITAAVMDVPVGRPRVDGRSIPMLVCNISFFCVYRGLNIKFQAGVAMNNQRARPSKVRLFVRARLLCLVTLYMKVVRDQRQDACPPVRTQAKDQPGGTS